MAYETTLDDWQKPEREDEGYGWPDHGLHPYPRVGQYSSTRIMKVPMMWPTTKSSCRAVRRQRADETIPRHNAGRRR